MDRNLGIVCCYYNPCNYISRFINYIKFISEIKKHKIDIVTVEAYNNDSKYRVNKFNDRTISVKVNQTFWMKECLLNIGITTLLDASYENIAWLDCDIIFENEDWISCIHESLKKHNIVQVFSEALEVTETPKKFNYTKSTMSLPCLSNNLHTNILNRYGDIGYGYAYKSDILRQCKLYDRAILGTGDFLNMVGCIYSSSIKDKILNDRFFKDTTNDFIQDYIKWAESMSFVSGGNIGYCQQRIKILPHGKKTNREYISRESIIKKHRFKPTKDLNKHHTGVYEISNRQKKMLIDITEYFKNRKEDSLLNKKTTDEINKTIKNISFFNQLGEHLEISSLQDYYFKKNKIFYANYESKLNYQISNDLSKQYYNKNFNIKLDKHTNKHLETMYIISQHKTNSILKIEKEKTLTYTKSGKPKENTFYCISQKHSVAETYLNHIISEYDNLPKNIVFLNDLTISESINNWIELCDVNCKNLTSISFPTPIRRIPLGSDGHLRDGKYWRNKTPKKIIYDFKTWYKNYFSNQITPTKYNSGSTFMVPREKILKRRVNFYKKLLDEILMYSEYNEVEHYIEFIWADIFK